MCTGALRDGGSTGGGKWVRVHQEHNFRTSFHQAPPALSTIILAMAMSSESTAAFNASQISCCPPYAADQGRDTTHAVCLFQLASCICDDAFVPC